MLDVVLKNGTVLDGTGGPQRQADVGIRDGRIVAIGAIDEPSRRTLDVSGRYVAPGFVDIHTHLDAALFWDPYGSPSSLHGVTSVVGGNCGFSIAPANPEITDYIMRLLSRVEGIPLSALERGLPWDWRSTGEFLSRLDGSIGINAGFFVGHSALRGTVMGAAATQGHASEAQLEAMVALYRRSLEEGGLGFSTSWLSTHRDGDGNMVPSRHASEEELLAFARATADHPGTVLEFSPPYIWEHGEVDLLSRMSRAAGRSMIWAGMVVTMAKLEACMEQLRASDHAAGQGGKIIAQILPLPMELLLSFATGYIFDGIPGWGETMGLPIKERMVALSNVDERTRLAAAARAVRESDSALSSTMVWEDMRIVSTVCPENDQYQDHSVGAIADREGRDPFDTLLDIVLADDLQTIVRSGSAGRTDEDWKARADVLTDPRAIPGAADAGAHIDMIDQFSYPTELIRNIVRERQFVTLEDAVHILADRPARAFGLRERGRLVEGWHADVIVFDLETIRSHRVEWKHDLPGGAGRLYAGADGIEHVFVNGVEVVDHGAYTGALPGTVLRSGRDTETVPIN